MTDWNNGGQPSHDAVNPNAASTAPGWYPDPSGRLRWWDGSQWGPYAETPPAAAPGPAASGAPMGAPVPAGGYGQPMPGVPNPRSTAALAHWLGLLGFIGPLVIYVTSGNQDPFVRHHSAEALNFHITVAIGLMVSAVLICVGIGIITFFLFWIGGIVLSVMAALAASRGEWYKYPFSFRIVSGAAV